jgi:uncharacterized RDD family membrane protein YckC
MVTPADNNFAPPKSFVADVAASGEVREKASRGSRLGATFIDGLIFGLPFVPSYIAAMPTVIHRGGAAAGAVGIWSAIAATGSSFYFALFALLCTGTITAVLVHRNGQTIGKKWLGIKVVRKDGSRATLGRIFGLRYLLNAVIGFVPLVGPLYGLIDALFIFGEAKRCCHDYLADTIVVQA